MNSINQLIQAIDTLEHQREYLQKKIKAQQKNLVGDGNNWMVASALLAAFLIGWNNVTIIRTASRIKRMVRLLRL